MQANQALGGVHFTFPFPMPERQAWWRELQQPSRAKGGPAERTYVLRKVARKDKENVVLRWPRGAATPALGFLPPNVCLLGEWKRNPFKFKPLFFFFFKIFFLLLLYAGKLILIHTPTSFPLFLSLAVIFLLNHDVNFAADCWTNWWPAGTSKSIWSMLDS